MQEPTWGGSNLVGKARRFEPPHVGSYNRQEGQEILASLRRLLQSTEFSKQALSSLQHEPVYEQINSHPNILSSLGTELDGCE